jgi:DNA-binding beta-propeller fold protein YncE
MNISLAGRTLCSALLLYFVGLFRLDGQDVPSLKLSQKIALAGVEGRIDHLALDASGERLFVCALGNNSVEVIDLRKGERIHSISGLGSPQGLVYVPELDRVFVADDKGGILRIYEATSFQATGELNFSDDADNVRYDDTAKKIYVGFGNGGIAVMNAPDGKQVGTIKLSGHPEAFALEKNGSRIFVNVPTSRHVAVIDRKKGEVVAKWKTDLAFGNFPMALDEANHRLIIGCRTPSRLLVLNTDSGEVVAKVTISGDTDDLFYDSKRHRIYAICGSGEILIIEQIDANNYKTLSKVDTAEGARTGWFSAERDTLFVAVPDRGSQSAEIRVYRFE